LGFGIFVFYSRIGGACPSTFSSWGRFLGYGVVLHFGCKPAVLTFYLLDLILDLLPISSQPSTTRHNIWPVLYGGHLDLIAFFFKLIFASLPQLYV
jgi:hypothetical protein